MKLDKNLVIGLALGAGLAFIVPKILEKSSSANLAFRHPRHFRRRFLHPFLPYPYFIPPPEYPYPYPYPIHHHRRYLPFGFGEGLYETPIL